MIFLPLTCAKPWIATVTIQQEAVITPLALLDSKNVRSESNGVSSFLELINNYQ